MPRLAEVVDRVDTAEIRPGPRRFACRRAGSRVERPPPGRRPGRAGRIGALFFTSGTTGPSKAVATTWHYLFTAAATRRGGVGTRRRATWCGPPCRCSISARRPRCWRRCWSAGRRVLSAAFRPSEVWDEIRSCGAAGFAGAGAMVSMLWNQPPDPRDARGAVCASSRRHPSRPTCTATSSSATRCRIVTMYGMTEAFPIAFKTVSEEGVPGNVGTGQSRLRRAHRRRRRKARTRRRRSARSPAGRGSATCDERGLCRRGRGRLAVWWSSRTRSGSAPAISAPSTTTAT